MYDRKRPTPISDQITSLRSKRFQSSYCAKVRAEASLPLPRHSFFVFFLLLSQFSRRTSRGNACYAGYQITTATATVETSRKRPPPVSDH